LIRLIWFVLVLFFLFLEINAQEIRRPKNIILLIGDGMGLNYVAANILKDQNSPFKKFTTVGLSITKSIDELITDSAAAATAIATGYPTKNKYISMDSSNNNLYTIFELARKKGLSTGIVVTDDVTGATPAPFFAHINSRYERFDIAKQFINSDLDVVIGGGAKNFLQISSDGNKSGEVNIIKALVYKGYGIYYDFINLSKSLSSEKIFGLLAKEGLPAASKREYTLCSLTSIALNRLKTNKDGFILMVEGSQIDWAGHDTNYVYLLSELEDFSTAVNTALEFAQKDKNTLVIVTADHETGGMAITDGTYTADSLKIEFVNTHHTAGLVGVFATGPGEDLFKGIYDNYMIGRKIFFLLDDSFEYPFN